LKFAVTKAVEVLSWVSGRSKTSLQRQETFENEAALLAFLRRFNLERWTPEQVLEQLNFPLRKDEKSRHFLVIAREAAKGAAAGKG
jgi:hypothetical protein